MGIKNKKNKSSHNPSSSVPNAPDLQQVLLASHVVQQPPHNPYYPQQQLSHYDPILSQNNFSPPPPYNTDHYPTALQMSRLTGQPSIPLSNTNYSRLNQQPPAVIIHQQASPALFDRKVDRYHRRVSSYNTQVFLLALTTILLSVFAESLYDKRNFCNGLYSKLVVAKFSEGNYITMQQIREAHFQVAGLGCVILVLSLIKCAVGRTKGYCCYLFLIGLLTLVGTLMTASLAYCAFYTPCTADGAFIKAAKSIAAAFMDKVPMNDKDAPNILQEYKDDVNGLYIFCIDAFNFAIYLSAFICSMTMC